jgi:hypothetical protein
MKQSARELLKEGIEDGSYASIFDGINVNIDTPFFNAIIQYAEDYANQIIKYDKEGFPLNANGYHFECWKRDGRTSTKIIIAADIKDAKLLFSAKYPDYAFDEPY